MAVWEQILTSGTPINKLVDVDETGVAAGDILIWDTESSSTAGGAFVTNVLQSTADEIHVDNTTSAGLISIGLDNEEVIIPLDLSLTSSGKFELGDDIIRKNGGAATITIASANDYVTLAGDSLTLGEGGKIVDATTNSGTLTFTKTNIKLAGAGEVTGALTVGGGYGSTGTTISSAGVITTDGDMTIRGVEGASATLKLHADEDDDLGDQWNIKAGNDDILRFTNDKAADGEHNTANEVLYLKGHATKTSTKAVVSGKLDVEGTTITLGSDSTLISASNVLTVTEGTIALTGEVTASAGLDVTNDVIVQGGKITMSNGAIIDSETSGKIKLTEDDVETSGTLTVVGDLITFGTLGATIQNTTAHVLTITEATTAFSGDLQVSGDEIKFTNSSHATIDINDTAAGTDGKHLTISASSSPAGSGNSDGGTLYLKAGAGDGTGTSAMEFHTKVSGTDNVTKAMEINSSGDVTITRNLTVSGTTVQLDTEIIKLEDNAIVLNSNSTGAAEDGIDGGIIVKRGNALNHKDAALFWDESYNDVDRGTTDLGGRWAVGPGGESSGVFTTPPDVTTYGGYLVGITESTGVPVSTDLATGLGAMHIDIGTPGDIYIRVQ